MTKPTIFLSHSKKDRMLIEQISNDLRLCRVNVWYDEWEIPPGVSFRRRIFEEAIPNCDCFFVYLSANSVNSYWVQKELDAAFIEESRNKNVRILPFVDSSETIHILPSDIAALNLPVLNLNEYENGLRKLITAIFEAKISKTEQERSLEAENMKLRLEKEIVELRAQINSLTSKGLISIEKLYDDLGHIKFSIDNNDISVLEIFKIIYPALSDGATSWLLGKEIRAHLGMVEKERISEIIDFGGGTRLTDLVAPLIIRSIIELQRPTDESNQYYYLSNLGKDLCLYIEDAELKKITNPALTRRGADGATAA